MRFSLKCRRFLEDNVTTLKNACIGGSKKLSDVRFVEVIFAKNQVHPGFLSVWYTHAI